MRRWQSTKIPIEACISIAFGIIYLLIPTKMYYIDGVYYAEHIENMPWHLNAFHPHHLLYLPIAHFVYNAIHAIIPALKAMTFLQVSNAIFGALSLWIFSLILGKVEIGLTGRIFAIVILGSSYTFWHHASDANIYIPASFLCLLTILIILSDSFDKSQLMQFCLIVLLAFASMIHQISLVMLVPAVIYMLSSGLKQSRIAAIRVGVFTLLILIIGYAYIFALYHGDTPATSANFIRWVTAFGQGEHYFTISEEHPGKPPDVIARGHAHAFFPLKPLERVLYDQKSGDTPAKIRLYKYFLRLTCLSLLAYIIILLLIKDEERKRKGFLFFIIFIVYFIITSVFMPENHFYRIFYLPSLIAIWAMAFASLPKEYKKILKPVIAILIALFFINNLTKGIIPESKAENNPYLALTREINSFTTSDDVVIFAPRDRYFTGIYRYFGKGDALHLQTGKYFLGRDRMLSEIDKYESETYEMLKERYHRIYIAREAIDTNIDPFIFTPNNYRLPHPEFMIIHRDRFQAIRWVQVGDLYFAECALVESRGQELP